MFCVILQMIFGKLSISILPLKLLSSFALPFLILPLPLYHYIYILSPFTWVILSNSPLLDGDSLVILRVAYVEGLKSTYGGKYAIFVFWVWVV